LKPIETKETNCIYAKDQPEYIPLPCKREEDGTINICWQLTWKERFKILFKGKIQHAVLTFNQPLQPVRLHI